MPLILIASISHNRALGNNNALLYRLPDDMRHFRATTSGHTVLMGRKTFDSLPKGALPHRRNIVVSRSLRHIDGAECYPTLDEALHACHDDEQVYVIGGASIYAQLLDQADNLLLTIVDDVAEEADAFFPAFDAWRCTKRTYHPSNEQHAYPFWIATYQRTV